jgi:hypothetical protein
MDDLKKGYRAVETKVKEVGRELDGHSLNDDIGNAGDQTRKNLGNAGDDLRRAAKDAPANTPTNAGDPADRP